MPLMRTPLLVLPRCGLECPHRSPHAACPYILQKGCLKTPERGRDREARVRDTAQDMEAQP